MAGRWKFEVYENGMRVVEGDAPDQADALREAAHYVMMYGQDGNDVKSLVWTGRKPKLK